METVVALYSCKGCGRILDEQDTVSARPCKCGSRLMSPAHPTKWNIVKYFLSHPKMLLVALREINA